MEVTLVYLLSLEIEGFGALQNGVPPVDLKVLKAETIVTVWPLK